jgi:uncharacterized membrane protein
MARNETMIAALKRERALYVSQGDDERVRQVDESLRHYGYEPDKTVGEDGPQGRTAAPQQTADQGKAPSKRTAKKAAPAQPGPTNPVLAPPAE